MVRVEAVSYTHLDVYKRQSDSYSARLTRRHNDSNVLCLGGELLGKWSVLSIVETWLTTEYDGGHHQPSLDLIACLLYTSSASGVPSCLCR